MNSIVVRKAHLKDAKKIATIHVKTWQHAYIGQLPNDFLQSLSIEKRTQVWTDAITNLQPHNHILVAEIDEEVVGFCSSGPCRDDDCDKTTGEIYAIYIDQTKMGMGLGGIFMNETINLFKKDNFQYAILWVLTSNKQAQKFYKKHGWESDGNLKVETRGDFELHETRYKRTL